MGQAKKLIQEVIAGKKTAVEVMSKTEAKVTIIKNAELIHAMAVEIFKVYAKGMMDDMEDELHDEGYATKYAKRLKSQLGKKDMQLDPQGLSYEDENAVEGWLFAELKRVTSEFAKSIK